LLRHRSRGAPRPLGPDSPGDSPSRRPGSRRV